MKKKNFKVEAKNYNAIYENSEKLSAKNFY